MELDCENLDEYVPGGYHKVEINDKYNDYTVVMKLGYGFFSTVWECIKKQDEQTYAVKIMKSSFHEYEQELKILKMIDTHETNNETKHFVKFKESFFIEGPNGIHPCFVFEMLFSDLFSVRTFYYYSYEEKDVKIIMKKIFEGLDFLHRVCKMIHADLKLENVFVTKIGFQNLIHNQLEKCEYPILKIGDFGACREIELGPYFRLGSTIETMTLERILDLECNEKIDVWSAGCLFYELLYNKTLFDCVKEENWKQRLFKSIIQRFGIIPDDIFNSSPVKDFYKNICHNSKSRIKPEQNNLANDLLLKCFEYDTKKRISSTECLSHSYFA